MTFDKFWTDERVKLLKKYVIEKELSFGQIAIKMRCSRNAALAKAFRMGIKAPAKAKQKSDKWKAEEKKPTRPNKPFVKPKPKPEPRVEATPKPKVKRPRVRLPFDLLSDKDFADRIEELRPRPSGITDIPGTYCCKWITGDVRSGNATWCAKPVLRGTKWCPKHYKLVYQTPAERTRSKQWKTYIGSNNIRNIR